uniref:Uncharacterized protein n=1 Tax=Panagrolaimus sp. ES5 TaxID=591445 RepID=A0AC34GRW2_9BILA
MQNRMNSNRMDGNGMYRDGMYSNGMNPNGMNSNGMYDNNGMYRMNNYNNGNGRMMSTSTPTPLRAKRGAGYYNQQRMNGNQLQNSGSMPSASSSSFEDGQMYTMPYYNPQQQQQQQQQIGMMNRYPM